MTVENDLLLWLSARRSGSWSQYRLAIERFQATLDSSGEIEGETVGSLPEHQTIRQNLERLAHVEFFTSGGEWRVTPPTLAHNGDGHAMLCGARTPNILRDLRTASTTFTLSTTLQAKAPDALVLAVNEDQAAACAADVRIRFQASAPSTILKTMPPLDDPRYWRPAILPVGQGWEVDRFCVPELVWRSSSLATAIGHSGGLFRFQLAHDRRYFFCANGEIFAIDDPQSGKYLSIAGTGQRFLSYDETQRCLTVSGMMRPPLLVERALILCAGILPTYILEKRALQYENIPAEIFQLAARALSLQT